MLQPHRMETPQNVWGLSQETIDELGDELVSFHQEFAPLFKTTYPRCLRACVHGTQGEPLLMEGKRTYTGVAQKDRGSVGRWAESPAFYVGLSVEESADI